MGCVCSTTFDEHSANTNLVRNPGPWRHNDERMSMSELREMRELFWRRAPGARGGRKAIWESLEDASACHDDLDYKQKIINMNNIRLGNPPDMTVCFDETGRRYELPLYVLSDPTNLNHGGPNIVERVFRRG